MILRRSSRFLTVALLALAVAAPALPAHASPALPAAPALSTVAATTSHAHVAGTPAPNLYCGPFLDKVCQVICRTHCAVEAPVSGASRSAALATSRLTCSRQLEEVCSLVFGVLCTLRPNACPRASATTARQGTAALFTCTGHGSALVSAGNGGF